MKVYSFYPWEEISQVSLKHKGKQCILHSEMVCRAFCTAPNASVEYCLFVLGLCESLFPDKHRSTLLRLGQP